MEDVDVDSESSAEEEEEEQTADRPYNVLLQLLNTDSNADHSRKRRKLDNGKSEKQSRPEPVEDEKEPEDIDVLEDREASDDDAEGEASEADDEEDSEYKPTKFVKGLADYLAADPFEKHFAKPDEDELSKKTQEAAAGKWRSIKAPLPDDFRAICNVPESEGDSWSLPVAVKSTRNLKVGHHSDYNISTSLTVV
jgi:U3 small nucleolar RNA-associated protein 25